MRGAPTHSNVPSSMDLLFPILLCLFLALAWWPWCCCEENPCPSCIGELPQQLSIAILGVVNGTCGKICEDDGCESINDTFVLDYVGNMGNDCDYEYAPYALRCSCSQWGSKVFAYFTTTVGGYALVVGVYTATQTGLRWSIELGEKPDCEFEGELELTPDIAPGYCDNSASTCKVSIV